MVKPALALESRNTFGRRARVLGIRHQYFGPGSVAMNSRFSMMPHWLTLTGCSKAGG